MIQATVQTLLKRPIQRVARIQIQQAMSLSTTNDSFAFYPVPRNRNVRAARTDDTQESDASSSNPRECFSFYPSTGAERTAPEAFTSVVIKDAKRARATLLKKNKNKKEKEQQRIEQWDDMIGRLFEEKMEELGFEDSKKSTQ